MHILLSHNPYKQPELAVHRDPSPPSELEVVFMHFTLESPDMP